MVHSRTEFVASQKQIVSCKSTFSNPCSMADGISFDVSLSLNCIDLYKRGGVA